MDSLPDADIRLPGFAGLNSDARLSVSDKLPSHDELVESLPHKVKWTADELASGVPEGVFGATDDRQRVVDTRAYPFSSICSLSILNRNSRRFYGTGFLAGPRLVITAGHNVYYPGEGFMRDVLVYPGLNGDRDLPPFRGSGAARLVALPGWIRDGNQIMDLGAIFLPTDLGRSAGFLSISKLTDLTLAGLTLTISGYPKVAAARTQDAKFQWKHSGRAAVEVHRLRYLIETSEGQSGAPLIAYFPEKADKYHAVGVHNRAFASENAATRINNEVFAKIVQWREESENG